MNNNYFLTDLNEYLKVRKLSEKIFIEGAELPDQVFQKDYSAYQFINSANFFGISGWPILQKIARFFQDEYIYIMCVKPDPYVDFYNEHGYINCAKIPIGIDADEYYDSTFEYNEFYLLAGSDIVIWFSPNMDWGILADLAFETCVLTVHHDSSTDGKDDVFKDWESVDFAVNNWMKLVFYKNDCIVPKEIKEALILNYAEEN